MLAYSEASIYPLRISKEENRKHVINLLLLDTTRSGQKKRYCLINNMRRLLPNQASKDKKRKEFCLRCLSHFSLSMTLIYSLRIFLSKSEGSIKCIPNNEEKYLSFSKDVVVGSYINKEGPREVKVRNELRFIDSFKFMASFLGKLVSNLSHES